MANKFSDLLLSIQNTQIRIAIERMFGLVGVTGSTSSSNTPAFEGDITGDVTGNVTGDVTGDLTGNVTGNVTGDVTGDVAGELTGNVVGTLNGSAGSGVNPNILINGGMDLSQRGTSWAAIPHFTPTIARWVFGQSAGTAVFTLSQETDAPSARSQYSLKALCTTDSATPDAGHEAHLRYAIEGRDDGSLIADQTVTLSFYVKSNMTGQFSVAINKPNSAGTTQETYLAAYTVLAADTWELKEITVDLSTSSDNTWRQVAGDYAAKIRFSYYAGTTFTGAAGWQSGNFIQQTGSNNLADTIGNYLQLSEVKLEVGSSATAFEAVPITETLSRVQRYELIIGDSSEDSVGFAAYMSAGNTAYTTITYPTTMCQKPSVTIGAFSDSNLSGSITVMPGKNSATLLVTANNTGRVAIRSATIDTPLFFDAEL